MNNSEGSPAAPASDTQELPALENLHERHPGVTPPVCQAYAEAAAVCLSRHHSSPTEFELRATGVSRKARVRWNAPGGRQLAAWNNQDDATRDGAYAMSLAAIEFQMNLIAVARAETRTGADYYVGPRGIDSLEQTFRLEISGLDQGSAAHVGRRLQEKVLQARRGASNLPALAAVVGFLVKQIAIATVTEP